MVYGALSKHFNVTAVLLEGPVSARELLRRRARRLGWFSVLGQCLFQAGMVPLLRRQVTTRIRSIIKESGFARQGFPDAELRLVSSVNDDAAVAWLRDLRPAVVVVNGTRIISSKILEATKCPFINTHAGITPA